MKRPLAYLTAAWSGEPDVDMELAAHYCRLTYEAGFSPICPLLYLPLFLNDSVPEEHKTGIDMRRDMLRRSHTLIVCGSVVDEDVKNDHGQPNLTSSFFNEKPEIRLLGHISGFCLDIYGMGFAACCFAISSAKAMASAISCSSV